MTTDTLDEFYEAVQNDNTVEALGLVGDLREEIGSRSEKERALKKVARRLSVTANSSPDAKSAADEYVDAVQQVGNQRLTFGYTLYGFVEGEVDTSEVVAPTQELVAARNRVNTREEALRTARDDVSVPPILVVSSAGSVEIPEGSTERITLQVENIGTETAQDITVTVTSSLPTSTSPESINEIPSDTTVEITVTVEGSVTGTATVDVDIDSNSVSTTASIQLRVVGKVQYLDQAHSQIKDLRETVAAETDDTTEKKKGKNQSKGGVDGILNKLRTAAARVERIQKQAEEGTATEETINERIGDVIELLETVISQARALPEQQLDSNLAGRVIQDTGAAIETLKSARDAEL